MSYQLQPNSPQIGANGRSFALGAFQYDGPISIFVVGVFEEIQGQWNNIGGLIIDPVADKSILDLIHAAGGIVAFNEGLKNSIHKVLSEVFPVTTTPTPIINGEPTTYDQAAAEITAFINGLKFTFVNGVLDVS